MDDATKRIMQALAVGAIKKGMIAGGAILTGHGIAMGFTATDYAAASVAIVAAGWSFWNDFGKAIVLSHLEVWKATALAQADKLHAAGMAPPSPAQIADKSPVMTTAEVVKVKAKMDTANA